MSTFRHSFDIGQPFLGGVALGQRQLSLQQQQEQDTVRTALAMLAMQQRQEQNGIQNRQWDQGFQLDQQRFGLDQQRLQQQGQQFDANQSRYDRAFDFEQQQYDEQQGRMQADSAANTAAWEQFNPPPMSRDPGAYESWQAQREQFAKASPQTQSGFIKRMEERQKQHQEQFQKQQQATKFRGQMDQLEKLGLMGKLAPESRAMFEVAMAAGENDIDLPGGWAGAFNSPGQGTNQSRTPLTPEEAARLYPSLPPESAASIGSAYNAGQINTLPTSRMGVPRPVPRAPMFGSISLDAKTQAGGVVKLTLPRGNGSPVQEEVLQLFRDHAAALVQPRGEGNWLGYGAEPEPMYQERVEKRAKQLAAQAGWQVNAPVVGGVTPGGAPGGEMALPSDTGDGIPTLSPQEAAALPPGTRFRGTDGKVRISRGAQ